MAKRELKRGDAVEWETSQGTTHGKVQKKVTSRTHLKGHVVAASEEEPQYLVKSDKSGELAAHKAEALKKRG